jgi:chemotaxis protein methyltransferase WspC
MNFAPVLDLLSQRLGLDPETLGTSSLRAALSACMRVAGCADPATYAQRLQREPATLAALIEEIVVPETWFFRGGDLFWFVAEQAVLARRDRPGQPFRALSLPCSTGEEAYSLTMAGLELGLTPGLLHVDGVDISQRALAAARRGVYGSLSFRQTDATLRERYFRPVGDRWELRPEPREGVRFLPGNLIDPRLLLFEYPYDIVFCRNVFIYLTAQARQQALANLARLTVAGGLLCMSVAEALPATEDRFKRWGPPAYGLYRRAGDRPGRATIPPLSLRPASSTAPATPATEAPLPLTPALPVVSANLLDQARRLADQGKLEDALAACLAEETAHGASADLFALVGVIQQSRGEESAAQDAFRKALYLDANHREALTHLLVLTQNSGRFSEGSGLRRRLQRLGDEENP